MTQLRLSRLPGQVHVVTVGAALDRSCARELRRLARALLARSCRVLVVDLSPVRTADAAATRAALGDLAHEAADAAVELRLVHGLTPCRVVRGLLDDAAFETYLVLEHALRPGT